MKSSSIILLLALGVGCYVYAQRPPGPKKARTAADYRPRTLTEIAETGTGTQRRGNKAETMFVHPDILPSRVRVTYTKTKRLLPEIKKEVLRQWARLYAGSPEGYTKPYETEMLFTEGGKEYWLAVRTEALPRFEREVKKGEVVDLYLIRLGAARISGEWELLLLTENFQKPN